jgi:hypothetical protein
MEPPERQRAPKRPRRDDFWLYDQGKAYATRRTAPEVGTELVKQGSGQRVTGDAL